MPQVGVKRQAIYYTQHKVHKHHHSNNWGAMWECVQRFWGRGCMLRWDLGKCTEMRKCVVRWEVGMCVVMGVGDMGFSCNWSKALVLEAATKPLPWLRMTEGSNALCTGVPEQPGGGDMLIEVETGPGIWGRGQVGEGVGSSKGWAGWGIVLESRAKIWAQGGGVRRSKLSAKWAIDGVGATMRVPSRTINWPFTRRKPTCHCRGAARPLTLSPSPLISFYYIPFHTL